MAPGPPRENRPIGRPRKKKRNSTVPVEDTPEATPEATPEDTPEDTPEAQQTSSYRTLYDLRETWGDVTFELDSGDRVKASKVILVAQCQYFEVMFSSDRFVESMEKVIRIQGVSTEVFALFIKFCYFGHEFFAEDIEGNMVTAVTNSDELTAVFGFIKLCDRYNLPDIAEKTANIVTSKMVIDGPAAAIYILAQAFTSDCMIPRNSISFQYKITICCKNIWIFVVFFYIIWFFTT
jgi:hypothetical protein